MERRWRGLGPGLNLERQMVEWSDAIGCACGDSFAEQTFADFLATGPRYGNLPPPILAEVRATLRLLAR